MTKAPRATQFCNGGMLFSCFDGSKEHSKIGHKDSWVGGALGVYLARGLKFIDKICRARFYNNIDS